MFVCLGRTWNGGHLHTDITFFMIRRSTRNSTGKVWRGEGGRERGKVGGREGGREGGGREGGRTDGACLHLLDLLSQYSFFSAFLLTRV